MAQVFNLRPSSTAVSCSSTTPVSSHLAFDSAPGPSIYVSTKAGLSLQLNGRFSCLFSGNRKQEQARKALEGALGGK
ncbi:hypothetical protein F0562_014437 [Nyssa sinensis]|uniref:Uncharacterized protein n=1 Tax=Nyssa sinensis TaxID=561372 RepID=A0A5J4ZSY5_9ASTE|nr:hypothetical protein F0562_014437 [Nyssa sinensis]